MTKIYNIKSDSPTIEFIRDEISRIWNKPVGINKPIICDYPFDTKDLYDLKFNSNNSNVLCINMKVYYEPKTENSPHILQDSGYLYYYYSSDCTIKLKTFLEKNPQWSNIKEWATLIKVENKKCFYSNYNLNDKTVSITNPDNRTYIISIPSFDTNFSNILRWITSIEDKLTILYYRTKKIEKIKNIKRNLSVWVNKILYKYDYIDGDIMIFDIQNNSGSIYKNMLKNKILDINIGLPDITNKLIKREIESSDLEVKSITLSEYKNYLDNIYLDI